MTLKRIIACLDLDGGRVVKGVNFLNLLDAGDPVEIAKAYEAQGVHELILLDIKASYEERGTLLDVIGEIRKEVSIPLTVGGGIGGLIDFQQATVAGADKVSISSAGVRTPSIITECARAFGPSRVVIGIDVKRHEDGNYYVYIKGGRENTGLEAVEWAKKVQELGAGEILLTSMGRDGTKKGYDLEITKKVCQAVGIPVIASGGAGKLEDFYDAFTVAKADGALAASLFHFNELNIGELRDYLSGRGINVGK